jgi:predicted PurR-regulated permease PerM
MSTIDAPPGAGPQPGPSTTRVEIAGRTVWQVIGAILLTIVLLRAAAAARSLLAMVAIAFFFSLAMDPAVSMLNRRRGWRRGAAVGAVYAAGVAFVVLLVALLIPALKTLADAIALSADDWVANLNAWTNETFGVPVASGDIASGAAQGGELVAEWGDEAFGAVLGIASAGAAFVFNMATIAMFAFYFTADAPRVKATVLKLFSPATQERIGWTWDQAIVQTGGYFYSRLILMGINGLGFFFTMLLVGLPVTLAASLALFGSFVSVFIPAIGTYIGAAVPILITLAIQGVVPALVVLGYALVYQQLENYVLSPRISANTMSLNGGVAFGAALAGGAIAGPIGAFVSLPVAALITAVIGNYGRSHDVVYRSVHDEPAPADAAPSAGVGTTTATAPLPTTGASLAAAPAAGKETRRRFHLPRR